MSQSELSPTGLKLFRALIVVIFLLSWSIVVFSQPKSASLSDYKRQHLLSIYSSDWSKTDQFDLEKPLELQVVLQGLRLPEEQGYALLQFTLDITDAQAKESNIDPRTEYVALLQEVNYVKRLEIDQTVLSRGTAATLKVWPATPSNVYGIAFLVDEVSLDNGRGPKFELHKGNAEMDARKNQQNEPESTD